MADKKRNKKYVKPTTPIVKWDELLTLYKSAKDSVGVIGGSLIKLETTYKLALEADEDLATEVNGAKQTVMTYLNELDGILRVHSKPKETDENGNKLDIEDVNINVRIPFIGELAHTNDDIGIYMNLAVAYEGFMDKISASSEILLSHLFARCNEVIVSKNIDMEKVEIDV